MAEEKKRSIKIIVKIKDIKLLGFQVTEYGNNLKDPIPDDKYQAEFEIASNLNLEIRAFETLLTVKLFDKSNDVHPLPELVTMRVKFDLLIKNFDDIATFENNTIKLPDDLVKMAFSSAIGTARGMFVMCCAVYKFSNAIIPLINIDNLMKSARGL